MNLKILCRDKYSIAAVIEERNGDVFCPVLEFFNDIENAYQASAYGLLALIDYVSKNGLQNISTSQCHLVDKENKIYELIKGDLRLFFFKGHGDLLIIATHCIIKKSQQTKNLDKSKAINYKKQYQLAHDKKSLKIREE